MQRKTFAIVLGFVLCIVPVQASAMTAPQIHGFWEAAYGQRLKKDDTKHDEFNMLETRAQLKTTHYIEGDNYFAEKGTALNFKGDFLLDGYYGGKTAFELRELNVALRPSDSVDLKAGRQVLTWGTGDYLFVNDLFPKDYVSFFIGRDDEYLKKPSDALKVSFFQDIGNLDLVAMAFEPNTTAKGDRLSFFDSFQGGISGRDSDRDLLEPSNEPSNLEYALRYYRNLASNELAVYFFRGFDKNPNSYKDEANRQLFYRRLDVYGSSLRGPLASGIGNVEVGYYNSREDSEGNNRLVENSMFKALAGYSKDLGNDLRVGIQYQYEQRLDYGAYKANLLPADYVFDQARHIVTQRITKLFRNQTVQASLFNFYSPSDKDGYVRPSVSYDLSDQWRATLGANIPWGEDDITEFGMMKQNQNVFVRFRYSF